MLFDLRVDFPDQIVDLSFHGADKDLRVQQSRRADDLLGDLAGALSLILGGRGGHIDYLVDLLIELIKFQRTVIER